MKNNIMKNNIILLAAISAFGMSFTGCTASFSTGNNPANTAKSVNTASSPAANKTANSNTTAAKSDKPKPALTNEKKPEGTAKTAKNNPVPSDWIYVYDESKGYGFSVPAGTTGGHDSSEGMDAFVASTPAPSELGIVVLAFKDKTMTKDDLLNVAVKFLEEMGETVQAGKLTNESADYAVAEATTTQDGKKGKAKILVGTDVTDNYVMIIGGDDDKYSANVKTIDEIWGSFEMWSGGASSN
jgi:hypothetical protein